MTTIATTEQQPNLEFPEPSVCSQDPGGNREEVDGNHEADSSAMSHGSQGHDGGGLSDMTAEEEKNFIAAYEERQSVLQPSEILSENKILGTSSKHLSIKDFHLMRTVGTGKE